jgi:hypothetical protein
MPSDSTPAHAPVPAPLKPWTLPARGLTLFYGCPEMPRLSHYFLPHALMQGKNIVCLDGANRFDSLLIARFARQRGYEPSVFNERLRCARAFTCFQLTELLVRVSCLLQSFPADVLIVTALPDLYFDEDVRDSDAIASFRCALLDLKRLTRVLPVSVFSGATSSLTPRRKFLPQLATQANCVWRFSVRENHQFAFAIEKPGQTQLAS